MKRIKYSDMFWLFMAGNIFGVLIEGIFCIYSYGHWETHTVTIWGSFCLIYGVGAVIIYILHCKTKDKNIVLQFLTYAFGATVFEYACGALLKYGLKMKAWDYSNSFLNFDGLVCLGFTFAWGIVGVMFSKLLIPRIDNLLSKIKGGGWKFMCVTLSVFMALNLSATALCILRWSQRHRGIAPKNVIEQRIDNVWNDETMQKRFCEWKFID